MDNTYNVQLWQYENLVGIIYNQMLELQHSKNEEAAAIASQTLMLIDLFRQKDSPAKTPS